MKKIVFVLMVTVLVCLTTACTSTNIQRTTTVDGVGASRETVARATVVEIDYDKHTAVLKDANGQMQLVNVGPDAPNFSKVKVGDIVIAEVSESIVVTRKESVDEPAADVFETAQRDPNRPGAQKVTIVESTARVEKIDYETRIITLSGTNGRSVTTQVGPEVKRFNEIKPGDIISMQIVKQTIIRVETPE